PPHVGGHGTSRAGRGASAAPGGTPVHCRTRGEPLGGRRPRTTGTPARDTPGRRRTIGPACRLRHRARRGPCVSLIVRRSGAARRRAGLAVSGVETVGRRR